MLREVGREHIIDQNFAEAVLVLFGHVLEDVVLLFLHDLEGERAVVVLEHALIVVDERLARADGHHEGVVESGVANVMDGCADEESDRLQLGSGQPTGVKIDLKPQFKKNEQEFVTSMAWIEL